MTAHEARWPAGTAVAVKTLGNRKGTVVASEGRGRYRVQVQGVIVSCLEDDLASVAAGTTTRKARRSQEHASSGENAGGSAAERAAKIGAKTAGARIDLHGMRVEEALASVDEAIDRALLIGADGLEIVHGKGTGRIREALHRHLASMSVVAAFRLDPANAGVTLVHF